LIIPIMLGKEYKSQSSSLCSFLHYLHFVSAPSVILSHPGGTVETIVLLRIFHLLLAH
jgi:hypothetical protein